MSRFSIAIETREGLCPASLLTPTDQAGPWPAVLFFMDGFGIRPAMWEMGQRLADGGYVVLLPDLYYRLALISQTRSGRGAELGRHSGDSVVRSIGLGNYLTRFASRASVNFRPPVMRVHQGARQHGGEQA